MTRHTFRPFGLRDKIGYLFGDFGNDFTFIFSTTILMKFYTDVMNVPAGIVGVAMMTARFIDAFTDVAMGRICDHSPTRKAGKFKPWLLYMCAPVAIASFLIYQSSLASMPLSFKIVYLFVTYILWGSVFYTSINIPYGSMASAISANPNERQSLSTYRTMGATLAGLFVGVAVPLVAYQRLESGKEALVGSRVTLLAGIFSLLTIGCYLLCYALTTERVRTFSPSAPQKISIRQTLKDALGNRALISIIVASILMLLGQLTMQNMAGYIFPDYYNNATAQSVSTILMMVSMMIAALFAGPLAAKLGKAEVSAASNLFAALFCVLTFFIRPQNVWVFVALQTLCWLGLGMFSMVSWALITDVIDYAELKNGSRTDGSIYALYSFARKLGQAFASGISGWLLSAIGYNTTAAANGQTQSSSVLEGIFSISTLVPAVALAALAAVLWFWYPLHKKQVDANVVALKLKNKNI